MKVTVRCDRCGWMVEGMRGEYFTSGFYATGPGSGWAKYARDGEHVVCDACMWADPGYWRDYGVRDAHAGAQA